MNDFPTSLLSRHWKVALSMAAITVMFCGCGGPKNKTEAGNDSGDAVATSENNSPSDVDAANRAQTDQIIESMYGKIELKPWPGLTGESIGRLLTPEQIASIIGVEHTVTAKKDPGFPEWKYEWSSPDRKERGYVLVSMPMDGLDLTTMKIQAGVRLKMAEQGDGEEVDLSRFGAIAVYRSKKNTNDLQICTASKILIINTRHMRGRAFDDQQAMKRAAEGIARQIFERLEQGE